MVTGTGFMSAERESRRSRGLCRTKETGGSEITPKPPEIFAEYARRLYRGSCFLEKREASLRVLGDFVACGERVDSALLGFSPEVVKGDLLAALQFLVPLMEEV